VNYAFSGLLPNSRRHVSLQEGLSLLQLIEDVFVGVILCLNVDQLAEVIVDSGLILAKLKLHDAKRMLVYLRLLRLKLFESTDV
jgi:hypothetical protein